MFTIYSPSTKAFAHNLSFDRMDFKVIMTGFD